MTDAAAPRHHQPTPQQKRAWALAKKLRRQGFDRSRCADGRVRIRCSQCNALAINGLASHEFGCPNRSR